MRIKNLMQAKKIITVLSVMCTCLVALAAFVVVEYVLFTKEAKMVSAEDAEALYDAERELDRAKASYKIMVDELEFSIRELENRLDTANMEYNALKKTYDEKTATFLSSDERMKQVDSEIAALEAEIQNREEQIAEYQGLIDSYASLMTLDIGRQTERVSALMKELSTGAPLREIPVEDPEEEGTEKKDNPEEEVFELVYPEIALYYKDLITGYTIAYHAADVMYSASLIKAPYIWSMLKEIARFEAEELTYDEDGKPIYDEKHEMYDLNRTWTYDSETMFKEGSGKIKDMEDGTTMTYLELVQYAIGYSDNVAFGVLREMFGYTYFYADAAKIGVKSVNAGFMKLSAQDAGKFMEAIYEFMESDDKYGKLLKDAMLTANHRVLIPYAVSPKTTAHKYGWDEDSYHDMAVVYDDHPYILVIMTDLDKGGDEINQYIRKLASTIDGIHNQFYKDIWKVEDEIRAAAEAAAAEAAAAEAEASAETETE